MVVSSPIHTCSPSVSLQGEEMFMRERMMTPLPTDAPKIRSVDAFNLDGSGMECMKKRAFAKTQSASFHRGAPRLKEALLNLERSIMGQLRRGFENSLVEFFEFLGDGWPGEVIFDEFATVFSHLVAFAWGYC